MILRSTYMISEGGSDEPCPFCGSDDVSWHAGGKYSYDEVYCHHCLTEMTFYPPEGTHRMGGPQLMETMGRWERRADGGECPFCGGKVEYDGDMNYSTFFADAYCPTCRIRFEFQRAKKGKSEAANAKKAVRAMARRP